jgi:hypothetical protein
MIASRGVNLFPSSFDDLEGEEILFLTILVDQLKKG